MTPHITGRARRDTVPLIPVAPGKWPAVARRLAAAGARWAGGQGFAGRHGTWCALPDGKGGLARVLAGIDGGAPDALFAWGGLVRALPPVSYRIEPAPGAAMATRIAVAWSLGGYCFDRYRPAKKDQGGGKDIATLVRPPAADARAVARIVAGVTLVRDLVNTPAADMGPADLAAAARRLARAHGATCRVVTGDALLRQNWPMIHAVGRAAARSGPRAPRLIEINHGRPRDPKLVLVGKGVCFDSGGLDIKPASGMKLMKKDMGGAAHVLALAGMIMDAGLRVRLRVLVPAVENSVGGDAMRPLDVLTARNGTTVEIGHTDAEGRLVLADALAAAAADKPDLVIDCATLTGAARVALGPDLPALFCNDDRVAGALLAAGRAEADPMWRLPLWPGYRGMIDGRLAGLTNSAEGGFAGAITAALFLEEFVGREVPWIHLDMMAWNTRDRPGRPEGGEATGLRALYAFLVTRYGGKT